jgi:3-oxoacid CoA-transferase subunit B
MAWTKDEMCKYAAETELKNGMYVNLGIGIPTDVANHIPNEVNVLLHSENGMLGMGEFPTKDTVDPDLINAGKQTVTSLKESSYFDSSQSFAMIRGSHVDVTILGALEVDEKGNLANWTIPGKMVKGMGGAMDLVANVKRVVILMEHVSKNGAPKFVKNCELPLTGVSVVKKLVTDLGAFEYENGVFKLVALANGVSLDEIKSKTTANFVY